jgi:hypothetical protein
MDSPNDPDQLEEESNQIISHAPFSEYPEEIVENEHSTDATSPLAENENLDQATEIDEKANESEKAKELEIEKEKEKELEKEKEEEEGS